MVIIAKNRMVMRRIIIEAARILAGLVFVFSGFVKAVDPLGGTYKFEDYFYAFGWDFAVQYAFVLAVLLAGLEFITGVSLLFRIKVNIFSWIALGFMIVFTPLTLYIAINNPVTDCGCFGDAIKLSNWHTFYKNIFISALVLIVWFNRRKYKTASRENIRLVVAVVFIGVIMWYSYTYLPIIDFRPYKVGNNLPELMKIPENAPQDEYIYYYTLKNKISGKTKEIDSKEYIDSKIWQDTTWEIIATSDPVLVKEGYHPPVHDFVITSEDGDDITDVVLNSPNYFLLVSYDIEKFDRKCLPDLKKIVDFLKSNGYDIILLTASNATATNSFLKSAALDLPVYFGDEINLKTIIRSNPGLVLLQYGTVAGKWSRNNLPGIEELKELIKNAKQKVRK